MLGAHLRAANGPQACFTGTFRFTGTVTVAHPANRLAAMAEAQIEYFIAPSHLVPIEDAEFVLNSQLCFIFLSTQTLPSEWSFSSSRDSARRHLYVQLFALYSEDGTHREGEQDVKVGTF
ncbi:hypothetical protein [Sphingomonas sp. S2-65]|uniref:hypothetical protein n=1 Tax=Sphingomonas sp. S2-65 TaxID=2903960 RepID=UPI001F36BD20|nr:hypothetical protein [Sphingomonas sp. S2-65]UYY59508.1 hypothetical protein LZ586_05310 [Sphingomonas sp. S2-65]